MSITSADIKTLRDKTGISVMQCKKALEEAGGDMDKALIILKKRRSETAEKKSDRALAAGTVGAYIHNTNEVAALVLLSCETDFVAKNEEFIALAKDIAMHVAALSPRYIAQAEISQDIIEKAKEVFAKEVAEKPAKMQEQIMQGKLDAYFKEQVLLEQAFIKTPETTISSLIEAAIQKFGENIAVTQISRLSVK